MRYVLLMLVVTLSACGTSPLKMADTYSAQDEWLRAVIELRKAVKGNPENIQLKAKLRKTEDRAADFYYVKGNMHAASLAFDAAIESFQNGLSSHPGDEKITRALERVVGKKQAVILLAEAENSRASGRNDEAYASLKRANLLDPENAAVIAKIKEMQLDGGHVDEFSIDERKQITINVKQAELRSVFEFLAKNYGLNVLFDETVKNSPVTLYAQNVSFRQALDLLLSSSKTFYKKVGDNTFLIVPDTKEKRDQYQELIVKTFAINNMKAKDVAEMLKSIVSLKKVAVNEAANTIVVRDTKETLNIIDRFIQVNDRKPAEVLVDVEILEVNKTKADRLGLDFGSEVKVTYPTSMLAGSSISNAIKNGATIVLPSTSLRYFLQDVDAKSLANPKIRVLDGKSAKVLVGDRVPLRASTIVDATGQTRTTYDYKDVGIKLTVEPNIHADFSTSIKLGLEVSGLGANLGTANEPAYKIGTRSAESYMVLRDGETAIIGGLVQDNGSDTTARLPLLGAIPILGKLLSNFDNSQTTTDVLLTVTPRVVRGADYPSARENEIYSGTELALSDRPLFAVDEEPGSNQKSAEDVQHSDDSEITFNPGELLLQIGQEKPVSFDFNLGSGISLVEFEVLYNSKVVSITDLENRDKNVNISVISDGVAKIKISERSAGKSSVRAFLVKALQKGNFFLIVKDLKAQDSKGQTVKIAARSGRIVVSE